VPLLHSRAAWPVIVFLKKLTVFTETHLCAICMARFPHPLCLNLEAPVNVPNVQTVACSPEVLLAAAVLGQ
jgi:hypothetical protein